VLWVSTAASRQRPECDCAPATPPIKIPRRADDDGPGDKAEAMTLDAGAAYPNREADHKE
jgi:hypothetical protein